MASQVASLLQALIDKFGYDAVRDKEPGVLKAYRAAIVGLQGAFASVLTGVFGPKAAASYLVLWTSFVTDLEYYLWGEIFPDADHPEGFGSLVEYGEEHGTIDWTKWTAGGLAKG